MESNLIYMWAKTLQSMDSILFESLEDENSLEMIKIEGGKDFIERTKEALRYIKTVEEEMFKEVQTYIKVIKLSDKSGMDAQNKTFYVGKNTCKYGMVWYASAIVHDANHSKLYWNDDDWTGREAENACLEKQIEFFKKTELEDQTKEYYINHLEKMKETDYFSNYRSRDW